MKNRERNNYFLLACLMLVKGTKKKERVYAITIKTIIYEERLKLQTLITRLNLILPKNKINCKKYVMWPSHSSACPTCIL